MARTTARLFRVLLAGAAMAQLVGCSWSQPTESGDTASTASQGAVRQQIVDTASSMLGVPYRYGGRTPTGFDCSGLVYFSYDSAGIRVPRTSTALFSAAEPVGVPDARPGDLLFFSFTNKVSHVAIYLGDDEFVHAPSSGRHVSMASLNDPHYRAHFVGAGRLYTGR